ncbi:hypothetical protein [Adhaeribacter aquaticus]|uniref:hypothetical protein n=1 Tax=Adhaeribacter aquaticus TaxID=299567 RepID=UPI0012FA17B8|nr:hypothetical protein [Adhaeribacter aquaticus]
MLEYKKDRYLNAGTVYGLYVAPMGQYRQTNIKRGFGLGIENKITALKFNPNITPVYNINMSINRWLRADETHTITNSGTNIILSAQLGVNYFFPTLSETVKTYVQGLAGVGGAGSFTLVGPATPEESNHEGIGLIGTIGTGIYYNRLHLGLMANLFNPKLKNEVEVKKPMSTLYIRAGLRL